MSHTYRIATRADLPQIVGIYNSTVASRMVTADTEPVTVASREAWFDAHRPDVRPLWVVDASAEFSGSIAAWLSFSSFYGRPAYNGAAEISVYVREENRGRGLGAWLVEAALAAAPGLGLEVLLGFIFGHNEPSLRLFERSGFARWGTLPGVARLDGVARDLVIVGRRV